MTTKINPKILPVLSCLLAATLWGILWYPLRLLEQMGVPGLWATLIIYIAALIPILPLLWKSKAGYKQQPVVFFLIGLFAGWTNLAFILAVIEGPVVRVLLLFYLSPIWTVLLGWVILKERLSMFAWTTVLIALFGAVIMHWQPSIGISLLHNKVDLLAISSGIAFAVTNVCVRKSGNVPIILKMGSAWIGVITLSVLSIVLINVPTPSITLNAGILAVGVGCIGMIIMTYTAQYGVTHLPLYRSAVIFLFEIVAGAVSAALLTTEVITLQEWIGGLMVMLAAWMTAMDSIRPKNAIFSRLRRQPRAQILMYSHIHCGFARAASLLSQKNVLF